MIKTDILIIGAGPAACAAAVYTLRAGLKTIMLGGANLGGQLLQTNDIENYPGFIDPISGFEIMDKMHKQCKRLGAEILAETAVKIEGAESPFRISAESGEQYEALSVIIATGAAARWLGVKGEGEYKGKGVSACATCDGFFFKGKEVAVIGGGNTAFEDALFLTNFCSKVYLVHRRDGFRADKLTVEKAKSNPKIEMLIPYVAEEIKGENGMVTCAVFKNVKDGSLKEIKVNGVFIAVGSIPQTGFLKDSGVNLSDGGYVKTDEKMSTSVKGIFAAGDCADEFYKQAIVAAGSGAKAAIEAISFVNLIK